MSSTSDREEAHATLKPALYLHLARYLDRLTLSLDVNATPQFIASLVELTWSQLETASLDVEAFARHRGGKVVGVEDVLLLGRRNASLEGVLKGVKPKK